MPEDVKPWEKYQSSSSTDTAQIKPWDNYKSTEPEVAAPSYAPEPSLWDRAKSTVDSGLRLAANATGMGEGPITALETGAKNLAGLPGQVYHAFADEAKPDESLGGVPMVQPSLGMKRLLIDPSKQHASQVMPSIQDANTQAAQGNMGGALKSTGLATAHAAGILPGVGQIVSDPVILALEGKPWEAVGTLGSNLAIGKGIEAGLGKFNEGPIKPGPVRKNIQNLSTFINENTATGKAPQQTAHAIHPLLQQAVDELGIKKEDIATREGASNKDPYGDLYRGAKGQIHSNILKNDAFVDKEGTVPRPIVLATFDRMVDIADRPIRDTIAKYRDEPMPEVKKALIAKMEAKASEYSTLDPALSNAYEAMAEKVRATDGSAGSIDDLKVHANKEVQGLMKNSPSGSTSASATPVFAWKELGDAVRGELYPALVDRGAVDLTKYGRLESDAIHARDGAYKEWATAAGDSANDALKSYLSRVLGPSPGRAVVSTGARAGMASRAILPGPDALVDLNKRFANSIGEMRGYVRPSPVVNPQIPQGNHPLIQQGPPNLNAPKPNLTSTGLPVPDYSAQFHKNPVATGPNMPVMPPQLESINQRSVNFNQDNPLQQAQPGHPMTGLDVSRLYGPLPHQLPVNPIPASPPHSPIPTGLNTSIGPRMEPQTPLTHPLAGPLSNMNQPPTSAVKTDMGHVEGRPVGQPSRLNVAPKPRVAPVPPQPVRTNLTSESSITSPSSVTNQATSTSDVRYAPRIQSTGMFEQGIMPSGTQMQMPLAQQLRRLGRKLPTGIK